MWEGYISGYFNLVIEGSKSKHFWEIWNTNNVNFEIKIQGTSQTAFIELSDALNLEEKRRKRGKWSKL